MTYRPDNPFARPKEDPTEPETAPDAPKITTGFPFYDLPGEPAAAFVDDDTGRVNWLQTDELEAAYTGPGTKNEGRDDFPTGVLPPNWPAWVTARAAVDRVASLADALLDHGERVTREVDAGLAESFDWTTPLAAKYADAVRDAHEALEVAGAEARAAKKYTDPETGIGYQQLVKDRLGRDFIAQVAAYTSRYQAGKDRTARPLPYVTGTVPDVQWVIHNLLPRGGSALLVGSYKEDVAARLAGAVADARPFAGEEVDASHVVIIDAETPQTILGERYADAIRAGATLLAFRGRADDLDVREATVRSWLAQAVPEGSLVIVDSLPTLLGVLDVNELSADAGGYLAGWTSLVVETKAAGLVMLHDAPQGKPNRARGHGSITQWSDTVWAAHDWGKMTVDGQSWAVDLDQSAPPADPAKPEREAGGGLLRTYQDLRAAVKADPGKSTSALASTVGVSVPTAGKHLDRLVRDGVLKREVEGRAHLWYPA